MAVVSVSGPVLTFYAGAATVPQQLFGSSTGVATTPGVQAGEVAISSTVATIVSI